jgi:hypothetical protein
MKAFSIASSANTAPAAEFASAKIYTRTNKLAREKLQRKSARELFKANGNPWTSANIKRHPRQPSDCKQVIAYPGFKRSSSCASFQIAELIELTSIRCPKVINEK